MSIEISVIIPTHNRKKILAKCIDSIFLQNYPRDKIEVIVIDDGSNDGTKKVLDNLVSKNHNIQYTSQQNQGPAKARNKGVALSKAKIIGFVDDDCILDCDWVKSTLTRHKENPKTIAIGGITLPENDTLMVRLGQFLTNFGIELNVNGKKEIMYFPTSNVTFKRHIFEKYRFDERFYHPGGEDLEFFWRLFKNGYRFIYDKSIKVIHCRQDTLRSFIHQSYSYGRGNFLTHCLHVDHPFLKEFNTHGLFFWFYTLMSIIKIPYFAWFFRKHFRQTNHIDNLRQKISIYFLLIIFKISYLIGSINGFLCMEDV